MIWVDAYDRQHRPTILDIRQYLSAPTMGLLERLNHELFQKYRVKAAPPRYTQKSGWVFPYRLQGLTLFTLAVQIDAPQRTAEKLVLELAYGDAENSI